MEISTTDALASLKLLIAVARADGVLHDKELEVIKATLAEVELPDGVDARALLEEEPDVDDAINRLSTDAARVHAYGAAFALARVDGEVAEAETALLENLRRQLEIPDAVQGRMERLFAVIDDSNREGPAAIEDPERRQEAVDAETRKCAIISAVLGAFPFPGLAIATDLAVAGLQIGLARDIGQLYGVDFDRDAARALLGKFGIGTGARIAVTNLLKLFPGWGSAAGAAAAYATTYAVGSAVTTYFEGGDEIDFDSLRSAFETAQRRGREKYKEDAASVDAARRENAARLVELRNQLEAGEITQAEFERGVAGVSAA